MIHGATCRFCLRLRNSGVGEEAWNTVLLATKNFVVVPSTGAMVPGWLLLIPKAHQLSIAETPAEMRAELEHVLRVAGEAVHRRFGPPTVFEHGAATPGSAWGCGIDHAHLHLLPLPFDLAAAIEGRLPQAWNDRVRPTSICSWSADRPYIALRGPAEDAWSVIHPETIERQFIRRVIAEELEMPERYDYDQYPSTSMPSKPRAIWRRWQRCRNRCVAARRSKSSGEAVSPSLAYVLTDCQLTIQSTKGILGDPEVVGRKGAGLALLPDPWRPAYVVLSAQALSEAIGAGNGAALVLLRLLERALDRLGVTKSDRIICRSSVPDEGLERRGRYKSIATSAVVSSAAQAAAEIHRDALAKGSEACAVIVQRFLPTDANGHLSNEFRHAQRKVDFLFEVEEAPGAALSGLRSQETYSFRLPRPVRTSNRIQALRLEDFKQDLRSCLMSVAKWSCNALDRGHFEWVLSDGRLWLVQFDPESKRWEDLPLEAWKAPATSEFTRTLRTFARLTPAPEHDRWRKTRSHRILTNCHLFVPPIYILSSKSVLVELAAGKISPELEEDLHALVMMPLIIRLDVDTAFGDDWTNLPVGGPFLDSDSATKFLLAAAAKTISRGATSDGLAIVCHHFIPARAAAWATSRPNDARVKIDSIWGLPDGLQAFPYDTCVVDLEKGTIGRFDRYKDEFIDIDKDGKWVTRLTTDSRARSGCLSDEHATRIAAGTRVVAVARNQPTRVMWFIDTDTETLSTPVVPWILTDEEGSPDFWLETSAEAESEIKRIEQLRKRIMLGGVRRLRDFEDLEAFVHSSQKFDLGGRCVLFRPTALLLRNQDFLTKVAEVVKSHGQQWFLVFEGSLLAHAPYRLRSLGVRVISIWEYNRPRRSKSIRKLVRDLIPDKIRAHGESVLAVRLSRDDHIRELRRKLVEESLEALDASGAAELAEELADVLAVAQSLAQTMGIDWQDVVQKEIEKRKTRGGFSQGIFVAKTTKATELQNLDPLKVTSAGIERLRYRPGILAPLVPPNPRPEGWSFRLRVDDREIRIRVKYSRTSIRVELGNSDSGLEENPDQLKLF